MDEFIEYQRFTTLDDATFLIDLLDANQIPFKIDDSATRFDLAATTINPLEKGIVLQIRQSDKERVDQINFKTTETSSINDHYMYSLSDNDIIDAVVNSDGWTEEEQILAKEISKQRNLKPTAELIKSLRKDKNPDISDEQTKQSKLISGGTSWFLWIGIISALNIIAVIFRQNVNFVSGLGINYVILGITDGLNRALGIDLMLLGYVLSFLVCGLFILIWRKSKQQNKNYYLTGLIIYGIDTLFFLYPIQWYSLGFHVLALFGLYSGYKALLTSISDLKKIKGRE
jgi:hypothetical protein